MRHRSVASRTLLGVLLSVAIAAGGGCSSSEDDAGGPAATTAEPVTTASTAPVSSGATAPDVDVSLTPLEDEVGILGDVELTACDLAPGAAKAGGKVSNRGDGEADIAITIYWMPNGSTAVVGAGTTVLEDVAPGAELAWDVSAEVAPGAERCVINARRGSLAG